MCAKPRFSWDGSMIAFVAANAANHLSVQVMITGVSNAHPLVPTPHPSSAWTDSPTWTFAGSRIVYTTVDARRMVNVVSSNSDGSGPVTMVSGFDISVPAISPDGQAVAYQYSAS